MKYANTYLDEFAVVKYPKAGKCKKSCFADGTTHRVGMIPIYSVMDGAQPGDMLREICMECEKPFKKRAFLPMGQPSAFGAGLETAVNVQ